MTNAIGLLFLVIGTLIIVVGLALVVAEIISGRHSDEEAIRRKQLELDWQGIAAVINGLAAIFRALQDWPLSALLVLLGLISNIVGVWILAAKPFSL